MPPSEASSSSLPAPSHSGSTFGSAVWSAAAIAPHGGLAAPEPVADVVADVLHDLVWTATSSGHVSALHAADFSPYCSFAAVHSEVRAVLPAENYVLTLGASELRIHSRTGAPKSRFPTFDKLGDLFAATVVQPGQVCLGGTSTNIFMYDVEANRIALQVGVRAGTSVLTKAARVNTVYAGHMDGSVALLDPRSFRAAQNLQTGFPGGIQAMDVKDKLLCCSGYALDRGSSYLEGLVRVFDLRMMRPLAPVAFAPGAFRLKFHPVFSGTLLLMAQTGQLQVCDAYGSYLNLQV